MDVFGRTTTFLMSVTAQKCSNDPWKISLTTRNPNQFDFTAHLDTTLLSIFSQRLHYNH